MYGEDSANPCDSPSAFVRSIQQRQRVLRPQNKAVHGFAGEHIPGDAARIMAHAYVARLQPIAKPLRVIGGNIRTTARAENHIFFLAVFPGSPQRAPLPPIPCMQGRPAPPGRDTSPFPPTHRKRLHAAMPESQLPALHPQTTPAFRTAGTPAARPPPLFRSPHPRTKKGQARKPAL